MKRPVKQFFIFLGLLTLLTVIRFPYDEIVTSCFKQIKKAVQQNGVYINAETFRLRFPAKIELNKFSAIKTFKLVPISFYADKVIINPNLLSLFLLKPKLSFEANAYSGLIKASISKFLFSNKQISISSNLENLQLTDFPPTKTYGLSGLLNGSFQANLENKEGKPSKPSSAILSVKLEQGKLDSVSKIYGLIPLPKASDMELALKANLKDNHIEINTLTFFSSLGSLVGKGELTLTDSQVVDTVNIKFDIKLTTEGAASISPYLALKAKRTPPEGVKDWELLITKETDNKQINIEAIAK